MTGLASVSIDVTQIDTVPTAKVGQYFVDEVGKMWRYVKGGGTVAQYEYCFITSDGTFTATAATTTNIASGKLALVGCWQNATSLTSTTYGWVVVKGAHTGKYLTLYATNAKAYVTATAGALDDTATTLIEGLCGLSTVGGVTTAISAYAYSEMHASGQ